MKDMFCFQCQQTAHNTGCEGKAGVCGKKADTANYQDEIIGALIGLSRAAKDGNPTERTDALMEKALFTTITNVNFNDTTIREIISEVLYPILDRFDFPKDAEILINPSGRFVEGGPAADTGLTGRKLMVDTYGGLAAHGGRPFSGKDPTKVDRSAA